MKREAAVRLIPAIAVACAGMTTGCETFSHEGSVYKNTGRVADLLVEPTLDIQPEMIMPSWPIVFYDADGHGVFDVPVVASELALYAPAALFAAPMILIPPLGGYFSHPFPRDHAASFEGKAGDTAMSVVALTYGLATVLPACVAGMLAVTPVDIVIHDVPALVVGKPLGLAYRLVAGNRQATPTAEQPEEENE